MITPPPSTEAINLRISNLARTTDRKIVHRRRAIKVGITAGAIAILGAGGTTAFASAFPHYENFDGVVKSAYVRQFTDCLSSKGVPAEILDFKMAAPILATYSDPSSLNVVRTRVQDTALAATGHLIGDCQKEVDAEVGENIVPSR
jgi:hypothetical protein